MCVFSDSLCSLFCAVGSGVAAIGVRRFCCGLRWRCNVEEV